jgi:general secretion pathway protein I
MGMPNGEKRLLPARHRSVEMLGFTLLEVLIALALIAIGLVSLFGSQSRTLSRATEAKFNTIAPLLASAKLAEVEGGQISMAGDDGDFGDDYPGYTWRLLIEDAHFTERKIAAALNGRFQRISLSVTQSETRFLYTLTTYVPRKQQ